MKNSLYLFSPTLFFLLFFRASLDPLLDLTKSGGIGLGALLNLLTLLILFVIVAKFKFEIPLSLLKIWGAFLLLGLMSILLSPEKIASMRSFFSILTYFSFFTFAFYLLKSKDDLKGFIKLIIYSSVIPFSFTLMEFISPEESITKDGFRLFGSFSHPNIFAFYLVLIASLCFYALKSTLIRFDSRFLMHVKVIFLASLVCLIATKTRSAWIAMAVVFIVYGVMVERRYLLYISIISVLALMIPSVHERIIDLFSGGSIDNIAEEGLNSLAWREIVWLASLDYILDKPIMGHGYDTFSYYSLEFTPLEGASGFDAHNVYVQIAFDMGFLGLLAYLIIFAGILIRLFKLIGYDKKGGVVLLGLLLSYLLVGFSDNMLFYLSYNWYFWFLMGVFYYLPPQLARETDAKIKANAVDENIKKETLNSKVIR